jgi:hypothetical protein
MKILNYKELNKGQVLAQFDVVIEEWGVTFKKCIHFKSNDKQWVNFPSEKWTDSTGTVKYFPLIFMDKDKKFKFDAMAIGLIEKGQFEKLKSPPSVHQPSESKNIFDEEPPF